MAANANSAENSVKKIYLTVIEEVITNVREAFLDEGYDDQLLQELKQLWENKLSTSRAVTNNEDNSHSNNESGMRLPITQPKSNNRNSAANNNSELKSSLNEPTLAAVQALPTLLYSAENGSNRVNGNKKSIATAQLDGGVDGSSDEEDEDEDEDKFGVASNHGDDDDDDNDDKTNNDEPSEYEGKEDPDPLNSDDDLTDHESDNSNSDMFDTEHVIVCQYEKITRIKNRWKFHLKDGIMNLNGKDYLFSKANGDAEW